MPMNVPAVAVLPIQLLPIESTEHAEKPGSKLGRIVLIELIRQILAVGRAQQQRLNLFSVRCIHGLNGGYCAACVTLSQSGKSKQRASATRRFKTMAVVQIGVKQCSGFAHTDGFRKAPITRTVDGYEDRSGYYQNGRNL